MGLSLSFSQWVLAGLRPQWQQTLDGFVCLDYNTTPEVLASGDSKSAKSISKRVNDIVRDFE